LKQLELQFDWVEVVDWVEKDWNEASSFDTRVGKMTRKRWEISKRETAENGAGLSVLIQRFCANTSQKVSPAR